MDDFLVRALLAGIGVALVGGPLGCFVVWRRMAYFGDTVSHSALLGVALGYLLGIDLNVGIVAVSFTVALLLGIRSRRAVLASDTLLGILAHGTLALGLVLISFLSTVRLDLIGYLFGDILAVGWADLAWIWGGGAVVLILLAGLWRWLLAAVVHEELAVVEGVPATFAKLGLMLLLALMVSIALKLVGIVLVTSLLIIPAATARRFAATPEQMAIFAAVFGITAVIVGLGGSLTLDTPSGPSIVVAAAAVFLLSGAFAARRFSLPG